jgi:hypothetical protein
MSEQPTKMLEDPRDELLRRLDKAYSPWFKRHHATIDPDHLLQAVTFFAATHLSAMHYAQTAHHQGDAWERFVEDAVSQFRLSLDYCRTKIRDNLPEEHQGPCEPPKPKRRRAR